MVFAVPWIFSKHVPWLEGETSWNHPSTGICTVPQVIIRKTPASTTSWLLRMYGCSCASSSPHPSVFSWFFRLSFCRDMKGYWKMPSHFHLHFENKKIISANQEISFIQFVWQIMDGSAMDLSNQVLWVHYTLRVASPHCHQVGYHTTLKEQCRFKVSTLNDLSPLRKATSKSYMFQPSHHAALPLHRNRWKPWHFSKTSWLFSSCPSPSICSSVKHCNFFETEKKWLDDIPAKLSKNGQCIFQFQECNHIPCEEMQRVGFLSGIFVPIYM